MNNVSSVLKGNQKDAEIKEVHIPARPDHAGYHSLSARLIWSCPVCGGHRGEVYSGISYDGSLKMGCSTWVNPCGHVDKYSDVVLETRDNGLNKEKEGCI